MEDLIELSQLNKHYKKRKPLTIVIIDILLAIYILGLLSYLIFSIVFIKAQVIGISMQPLFNPELSVYVDPSEYENSEYKDIAFANRYKKGTNGDIVLLEILDDSTTPATPNIVIKRIIAVGGQRVTLKRESYKNGYAYFYYVSNDPSEIGTMIDEPYVSETARLGMDNSYFETFRNSTPHTLMPDGHGAYFVVPKGEVFVLGDNRPLSKDSHSPSVGTVKTEKILGKVSFYYSYNQNFLSWLWSRVCAIF